MVPPGGAHCRAIIFSIAARIENRYVRAYRRSNIPIRGQGLRLQWRYTALVWRLGLARHGIACCLGAHATVQDMRIGMAEILRNQNPRAAFTSDVSP